jgi:hypothetical protein
MQLRSVHQQPKFRPAIFSAIKTSSALSSSHIPLKCFRSSSKTRARRFPWLPLPCFFKKYSQMKLQMKREAFEMMNRLANEMPLDSGTGLVQ